jgi:hypothetical protein
MAKPTWEDLSKETTTEKVVKKPDLTYGKWNKDTLKLGAVPFSRSSDGKERKWQLLSSTKRRLKKRIPTNARQFVINDSVGLRVVRRRQ